MYRVIFMPRHKNKTPPLWAFYFCTRNVSGFEPDKRVRTAAKRRNNAGRPSGDFARWRSNKVIRPILTKKHQPFGWCFFVKPVVYSPDSNRGSLTSKRGKCITPPHSHLRVERVPVNFVIARNEMTKQSSE